jgi:hypothetical protein
LGSGCCRPAHGTLDRRSARNDVIFHSPLIARLSHDPSGTVQGKAALRACVSPQADTIASTHLRDDGLALELPLCEGSGWICEVHPDKLSARSPRTRIAVRPVRR